MKSIWSNEFFLKIISVVIAIVVWAYIIVVQNPEIEQTFKDVPVSINDNGTLEKNNMIATTDKRLTVDVKVRGTRKALSLLSKESISAFIDINGINKTGEYTLPINVHLQDGAITVVDKNPYVGAVTIDNFKSVDMPVTVVKNGDVKEGFAALDAVANPATIQLQGPEPLINNVSKITATIDVSGESKDIAKTVKYKMLDASGEEITDTDISRSTETVDISVPILSYKVVPIVGDIVEIDNSETLDTREKRLEPQMIGLAGTPEVLSTIEQIDLGRVEIEINSEQNIYEIPLTLPADVISVDKVTKVKYIVDVNKLVTKQVAVNPIALVGTGDSYEYSLRNTGVTVTLDAIEEDMASLDESKVTASVNVSHLGEGNYKLPIVVLAPNGFAVQGEYQADLTITQKSE